MGHAPGKDDRIARWRVLHLFLQYIRHGPAPDQQQADVWHGRRKQGHRGNEIVQPLIIVEAADKADHGAFADAQPGRQFLVSRQGRAEQFQIDSIGHDPDLPGRKSPRNKIVAQA